MFSDPVAQLVEQWPFKPLAVSSSLTRITRRQPLFLDEKGAFLLAFI